MYDLTDALDGDWEDAPANAAPPAICFSCWVEYWRTYWRGLIRRCMSSRGGLGVGIFVGGADAGGPGTLTQDDGGSVLDELAIVIVGESSSLIGLGMKLIVSERGSGLGVVIGLLL